MNACRLDGGAMNAWVLVAAKPKRTTDRMVEGEKRRLVKAMQSTGVNYRELRVRGRYARLLGEGN